MKRHTAILLVVILAACNSAPSTPAADLTKPASDSTVVKEIKSPYPIAYSSKFTIDDPKNAESVLALWKAYDDGNLSATKELIADSMDVDLASGAHMRLSRDSIIGTIQKFRSMFKSAASKVDAVMAVKSADRNEHWALIWGTETDVLKNGKVDSSYLQETWRFNESGKADWLMQFSRVATPPKK
ncbi:hypothetical protein [Puia sp.]|jgi:hypothetical protein|uniref:hypothetical protein n=1 Tax=Puia sp. TaxID=2045100 RepID=UPI002F4250CD